MGRLAQLRIGCLERAVAGLDWLTARREPVPALAPHLVTGMEGEDAAYLYLRRKGYVVVARRWTARNAPGDLDLVAWQGPMLCVVEVKTRTAHDMSPAEAAVGFDKRRTLRRLARQYLRQLPQETPPQTRFDVLSVYLVAGEKKEFVHFENAFGWNERRERR